MGGRPSLADFALYGPLYAHLYRDPASGEIMKARAPNVAEWVERLLTGDYAAGELADHVPETLLPILARHAAEHLPVLEQTNALLGAWAEGKTAGTEVPRALGTAMFNIEGVEGGIIARPFSLFRLQAALDVYAGLTDAERAKADIGHERRRGRGRDDGPCSGADSPPEDHGEIAPFICDGLPTKTADGHGDAKHHGTKRALRCAAA